MNSHYPAQYYDQPTIAIGSRAPRGSSRLTKVAVLAVFAAVAALGVEGGWLLSHHDTGQATAAPVVHAVAAAPDPIAAPVAPVAPVAPPAAIPAPVTDSPEYVNGFNEAPIPSVPSTVAAPDPGTPPAAVDPAPPAPAQPAPVFNVVLPPLPTAGGTTTSGTPTPGTPNSGTATNGTGAGTGSGATPNSKPSGGIGTTHLKDQEFHVPVTSAGPLPGTTGGFGNTAANPGGSAGAPAPGVSKFPSAAQRLFP